MMNNSWIKSVQTINNSKSIYICSNGNLIY